MTLLITKFKRILLVGGDVGVFYLALWITLRVRFEDSFSAQIWNQHVLPFTILYLVWLIMFYIFGLYDLILAKNDLNFYAALFKTLAIALMIGIIFFYFTPFFGIAPKTNLLLITALAFFLVALWRHFYNLVVKHSIMNRQIVVIGKHPDIQELQKQLELYPQLGYSITAILEPDQNIIASFWSQNPSVSRVLTAFPMHDNPEVVKFLFSYVGNFTLEPFPLFFERIIGKIPLSQIDEVWFLSNLKEQEHNLYESFKRGVDLAVAIFLGVLVVLLSPLIALAVKFDTPGPLLYSQERVGKNGKIFRLLKFRSMVANAEENGAMWAQNHDPRITRVGKILRKTFLDELPQCINILKGEMSFIGPRPERPEFVDRLTQEIPFYHIRHIVKPGITGWAQINFPYGNSAQGALEKLQYDLYYIKNRSLLLDFKILLKTVNTIFKGGTQ